ncbi:nucleotide sugar dehydrogenase [Microstroma glucosiphilum]|uniref:Nucleotide sugar dehydrogenase n=1 Tax=Pseudomicrostroma glucosiphilum TaxID=1684307 RepID=A0A316TW67_9BASI|nr:nucleotide sugar dehydrogenase [Pseudomicrostroma glucosiphilum]PWN17746.1 nucleotide sugar dehydrogenase [Pseudomicrostroma glucosiphilum]
MASCQRSDDFAEKHTACLRTESVASAHELNSLPPMQRLPSPSAHWHTCLPEVARGHRTAECLVVLIVGAGFVGEHLIDCFSQAFLTFALDHNPHRCSHLRARYARNANVHIISHVDEEQRSKEFDLCLISVPTLLLADQVSVDTQDIVRAVRDVGIHARRGSAVVIESSVKVGTSRQLLEPLRKRGVYVGYSPERVDPGRTYPIFRDIPKLVAGIDQESLDQINKFYQRVFTTTVPVRSLETAEMTKLFENCQRLLLISYVNEIADTCAELDIDIHDVCEAARTKPFGYVPFFPSLGAGGHCIPVNPWYLLADGHNLPTLRQAALSNQERPLQKAREIFQLATEATDEHQPCIEPKLPRILVYGIGFKKGSSSLAYSSAALLADELTSMGACVKYFDEAVNTGRWPSLRRADLHAQVTRPDGSSCQLLDAEYDIVVVTQSPDARDRGPLRGLERCRVIYFAPR